ncbi:SNF2 family N-terminal domain-containing protein [Rhypophila decipiens]|uniref:SNF2 family N-terminal domain-containing protein n=1 Tax=Rhypophila decipiens TaxID=261697 RepID=A0AAN7B5M5_9PEZI|nr:SNF2 family N-terminal domain-containing protein [Rhypophila decipiens]
MNKSYSPSTIDRSTAHRESDNDDTRGAYTIAGSRLQERMSYEKYEANRRVKPILKRHQQEAIQFILDREIGPLTTGLSLWAPSDDNYGDRQTIFIHVVTGAKASTPHDPKGGILADDFGLGKTLVILYVVAGSLNRAADFAKESIPGQTGLASNRNSKATLVIVPSALLIDLWVDQIYGHTFPGSLTYYKYHGDGRHENGFRQQLLESDLVLTTYATLNAEISREKNILGDVRWFRVVLDEAHEIRNRNTKQYQAVGSLVAQHRWCLTAIPIYNSVDDLGALVTFLQVPILEDCAMFRRFIVAPLGEPHGSENGIENLERLLRSICIRRSRNDLNLLTRQECVRMVELCESERDQYDLMVTRFRTRLDMAVRGHGKQNLTSIVLKAILELRLFCNHGASSNPFQDLEDPDLALSALQHENKARCIYCTSPIHSIGLDDATLISTCYHVVCCSCTTLFEADEMRCPKCGTREITLGMSIPAATNIGMELNARKSVISCPTKIRILLEDISQAPGQKSVILSSWKKTLDLIGTFLQQKNITYGCIHGSLSPSERRRIIYQFNSSSGHVDVLLVTIGTAVSLHLEVASNVYLMEPQWNSSAQEQAIRRFERLGQQGDTKVFYYVTRNTVEDCLVLSHQRTRMNIKAALLKKGEKPPLKDDVREFLELNGVTQNIAAMASGHTAGALTD